METRDVDGGLAVEPTGRAGWRRVLRRARRRTLVIGGAATLVVAGVVTVWAMSGSASSSDGDPGPTSSGVSSLALPGEVTVDESLPDALPLPEGIWSQTGPGWVLAAYRPTLTTWEDTLPMAAVVVTGETFTKQVVYLVSPEGQRYQVLEVDPDTALHIESWSAGETVAYVACRSSLDACEGVGLLDLTTGEVSPISFSVRASRVGLTLPGSRRMWEAYSGGNPSVGLEHAGVLVVPEDGWEWKVDFSRDISPDGRWVVAFSNSSRDVLGIASLETGAVTLVPDLPESPHCFDMAWVEMIGRNWTDESKLRLGCSQDTESLADDRWFVVEPTTGSLTGVAPPLWSPPMILGIYSQSSDWVWVSPGVWVGSWNPAGPAAGLAWGYLTINDYGSLGRFPVMAGDGRRAVEVGGLYAARGIVYFETAFDDGGPQVVYSYDPATGRETVLLPEPSAGLTFGVDTDFYFTADGVVSWVVAP